MEEGILGQIVVELSVLCCSLANTDKAILPFTKSLLFGSCYF